MDRNSRTTALRSELEELCRSSLSDESAALVTSLARPAVRLEETSEPTSSSLGGHARLDEQTPWPTASDGRPLCLIALIDLAEVAPFDIDLDLPVEGLLNVFCDPDSYRPGWLNEQGQWRAILSSPAERATAPPTDSLVLDRIGLRPEQTLTIPDEEEAEMISVYPLDEFHSPRFAEAKAAREAFESVADVWHFDKEYTAHQLGGWPFIFQHPIWTRCDLESRGFEYARWTEARIQHTAEPDRWRLLLELGDVDEARRPWGDGTLYFAVRQADGAPAEITDPWLQYACG